MNVGYVFTLKLMMDWGNNVKGISHSLMGIESPDFTWFIADSCRVFVQVWFAPY
ncbi:MAG: hypothetical protein ACJAYN_002881 [Bermanella sp.]|jgi:hypothetical protein